MTSRPAQRPHRPERRREETLIAVSTDRATLIDRIHQLRLLLPAMAHETAVARRDNARLRAEVKVLIRRVAELETRHGQRQTEVLHERTPRRDCGVDGRLPPDPNERRT